MTGEQVVDLACHLNAPTGHEDEVVGHPLQFGQHVRGEHDRQAIVRDRGHHRGHEVVPGERVEHRHRLVEHKELGTPGQRKRQRELRLLAAGQLAGPASQRDAQLVQPSLGKSGIEPPVQIAGHVQQVGRGEVLVEGRVLSDERDAVQRLR